MSAPGRVAVDASAARDAGRLGGIPGLRRGEVRDSRWEGDRDFPSAMGAKERLVLPQNQVLPEHRDEQSHPARQPRDASPKAVHQLVHQVAELQQVVPRWAPLAVQQAQTDESVLPQGPSLPAQQASRSVALLQVQEQAPWALLEQPLLVPVEHSALPRAQLEPRARSVSLLLGPHSLAVVPQARQASSARLSQPLPSLLFPLWQPLPPALPLRRPLEFFCALSRQRPRGSNSSASSFP